MQVWMSNTRSSIACELALFTLVCENLVERRGTRDVAERFGSLLTLASLPRLDQPQFLRPGELTGEIHGAWEELWTVPIADSQPVRKLARQDRAVRSNVWRICQPFWRGELTLGMQLARPLHELATFVASAGNAMHLRISMHRRLIVDAQHLAGWRVIQGGAD